MKINYSISKCTLSFVILYIVNSALGKGSALGHGETVQNYEVDPNYRRLKKTGFAIQERLPKPRRLGDASSSQKLLIRAKRLDVMEAGKGTNVARAKRLAKLVHDHNAAGRLLIRSKRRDLIEPMANKQLNRVKQLSFADHHGGHHGYHHESRLGEKHRDGHHEAKRHHDDGKASLHKKENRSGQRKELHAKKSMLHLKKKESHFSESHGQVRPGKKESHAKKDLRVVHNEKEKRREKKKKESHHLEKSKKSNVAAAHKKEKKEKKGTIHKVGGGHFGKKKIASASHGVGHSGHENNQRNLQVTHKKWKRNAKEYVAMATKMNYFKKNKKRSLKQ